MKATLLLLLPLEIDSRATGDVQAVATAVRELEARLAGQLVAAGVRAGEPSSVIVPVARERLTSALEALAEVVSESLRPGDGGT